MSKQAFTDALKAEGIPLFSSPSDQEPAYRSPFFHVSGKDFSEVHCPVAERAFSEEAVGVHGANVLLGEREDMDDVVEAIIKVKDNIDALASSRTQPSGEDSSRTVSLPKKPLERNRR